ncbi:MAG: hypothetical protein Q8R26_01950 [bacterium]|nr:hypothetical protein [bacterium]
MKVGWIIGILIVLTVIGGGVFYVLQKKADTTKVAPAVTEEVAESIEALEEAAPDVGANPIEKIPELNPVEAVNPFKYKNPFE